MFPNFDTEAFNTRPWDLANETLSWVLPTGLLKLGPNLFGIQVCSPCSRPNLHVSPHSLSPQVHRNWPNALNVSLSLKLSTGRILFGKTDPVCRWKLGLNEPSGQVPPTPPSLPPRPCADSNTPYLRFTIPRCPGVTSFIPRLTLGPPMQRAPLSPPHNGLSSLMMTRLKRLT